VEGELVVAGPAEVGAAAADELPRVGRRQAQRVWFTTVSTIYSEAVERIRVTVVAR